MPSGINSNVHRGTRIYTVKHHLRLDTQIFPLTVKEGFQLINIIFNITLHTAEINVANNTVFSFFKGTNIH